MPPRTPPKTQQARDPPPAPRRDATKRRVANPAALGHAARSLLAEFDSVEAVTQQELADPVPQPDPTQQLGAKPQVDLEPLPLPDLAPLPAATPPPPPQAPPSVMPPVAPKESTTQAGPEATPDDNEEDEAAV